MIRTVMWRSVAKRAKAISKNSSFRSSSSSSCSCSSSSYHTHSFLEIFRELVPISRFSIGEVSFQEGSLRRPSLGFLRNHIGANGVLARGYGSAAEAVPVSSTEGEEDGSNGDEVQQMLKEMGKAKKKAQTKKWRIQRISGMGMKESKYQQLRKRQVQIETEAWEQAAKEYRELIEDMCSKKLAPNLPYIKSLFLGWCEPMRDAIIKEREMIKKTKNKGHAKHFDLLPADMMSLITMHRLTALMMSGGGSVKVVAAACAVGEAIENEVRIHKFLEKSRKKKDDKYKPDVGIDEQEKLRKKVTDLMKKQKLRSVNQILNRQDTSKPWGIEQRAKVGSCLIKLLLGTAYIQPPTGQFADGCPDIRPAFVHTFVASEKAGTAHKKCGVIQCDPFILKGLEKNARDMVIPYMPMLVPPVKWTDYDKGAYFFLPSFVMRTHGARQQREVLKSTPKNQLKSVYEALDTLGSTRWRINNRVLSVVERIWNSGGCLAGLIDRTDVPLPTEPDNDDEAQLKKWKWDVRRAKKENMERHSLCCDIELKLAVARKMKDEEGFYYPHNVDFRGRAYPMHPYLNHLGSDLCRGILEFAEGRVLGKSGLLWLKIHLANVYAGGVDKLSFEGRIAFTENNLDDIFDSADKPLEGRRWWLKAEAPFQCLAVCMNLTEALRSSSPETFVSHIPIHQDGSCNGLQHYAALGRDKLGAAAVNLIAGEKPADVYSGIAARVLDIVRRDAEKDPASFSDALNARLLINQVDRKLVKQTVMTSVYGVTYIGARDQIKKRLKERGVFDDDKVVFGASCYAAKVTLTALGEMFESARCIMHWLGECAKIIASENEAVRWTTPLGLPAVQPYRQLGRQVVKTSLQVLSLQHETEKVIVKRQKTAFPPNFVHSLDGSHMMMTAVACRNAGLNFAGVHDSYWTHACNVDEMNQILREQFVQLYETPILENLLESFEQSFPGLYFPPLPERGDFNLRDVLESPYFFN